MITSGDVGDSRMWPPCMIRIRIGAARRRDRNRTYTARRTDFKTSAKPPECSLQCVWTPHAAIIIYVQQHVTKPLFAPGFRRRSSHCARGVNSRRHVSRCCALTKVITGFGRRKGEGGGRGGRMARSQKTRSLSAGETGRPGGARTRAINCCARSRFCKTDKIDSVAFSLFSRIHTRLPAVTARPPRNRAGPTYFQNYSLKKSKKYIFKILITETSDSIRHAKYLE